jgi:hypothetical protein
MNTPRRSIDRPQKYANIKDLEKVLEERTKEAENNPTVNENLQRDLAESYKNLLARKERGENVSEALLALRIQLAGESQTPDRYKQLREDAKKEQEKEAKVAEAIRERYANYQSEEEVAAEEEAFQRKLEGIRNGK